MLAAETPVRPNAANRTSRLLSVDVYRGLAVAGMLLVDYAGDEPSGYRLIRHAHWNGLTLADLARRAWLPRQMARDFRGFRNRQPLSRACHDTLRFGVCPRMRGFIRRRNHCQSLMSRAALR